jgi:hypothetical protein
MAYRPYIWGKNNPEKKLDQKRRGKIRKALRDRGILPPPNEPMNETQQEIYDQISNNDFSYWDGIKNKNLMRNVCQEKSKTLIKPPEYLIWYRARESSKRGGKEFNLEVSDIVIPEYCPYLGIKITTDMDERHQSGYYSIDRIDNNKGYVKGNVQIISWLANTMKNKATIEELLVFSENVIKIHKGQIL